MQAGSGNVQINSLMMFKQSTASIGGDFLVPEVATGHRRKVVVPEESVCKILPFATQNPKRTGPNFLCSLDKFLLAKHHATPILQGRYLEKSNGTTILKLVEAASPKFPQQHPPWQLQ